MDELVNESSFFIGRRRKSSARREGGEERKSARCFLQGVGNREFFFFYSPMVELPEKEVVLFLVGASSFRLEL